MTTRSLLDEAFEDIRRNYSEIRGNIAGAAQRSGRREEDIRFMAVTKTVPPVLINHALSLGVDLIGENKVQELLSKLDSLSPADVEKHIIGHLQTNKVRKIITTVSMIQSADSVGLAEEVSRQAEKNGVTVGLLLEINIGEEPSKSGFRYGEAREAAARIAELPGVALRGLMAVPPMDAPEAELRGYFRKMRRLFDDMRSSYAVFDTLSLGMSADYAIAIEEGATLVRVGSALFGGRRY